MKTILTFAAVLVPLAVWAAPATNLEPVNEPTATIRTDRDAPRPADPRAREKGYAPKEDRRGGGRDDRNDDRYDPRRDDRNDPRYDRDVDYRRPAPAPRYDYDRVIRHAYLDILEREPDAAGLRNYRDRMRKDGWTEDRLRAALRDSTEFRSTVVNNMITRSYREILGRAPDVSGLENYRYKIIVRGWSEEGLRNTLLKSAEYRDRMTMLAANNPRPRR